jgi:putative ABC transport system permease protein
MNTWLESFAYRTQIGVGVFVVAGIISLAIAFLTVSSQAMKASRTNPVDALRRE